MEEEFLVSLNINLPANTPVEAARLFMQWLEEDGPRAWVYDIEHVETGTHVLYDAELDEIVN